MRNKFYLRHLTTICGTRECVHTAQECMVTLEGNHFDAKHANVGI